MKLLVRDCVVNEALLWRRQNHDTLKAAQSLPYSRLIVFKMTFTASHPIWMYSATTTVDSGTLVFNGVFVVSAEDASVTIQVSPRETSTKNLTTYMYRTCAPNTVMLFSIQITCRCQFNLILILLVLRLFQSFFRLSFVVFTSETFRLYLVSSFCSCLAVRKTYAY